MDSVTNTIPNSNEATRKARRNGETLQHHFGTASYFLTINPDDEASYIIQIYSQEIIDNSEVEHNSEGNHNIEQTETLEVFFPDGTASAVQGRQENIDKFKELMKAAAMHGYTLEFRNNSN